MERGIKLPQSPSEWGFKGKNYLLIIGIDKYTYWKPLYNAVKDVHDISKLLTERYQFEADKTITLLNEEATEENIRKTLLDLKRSVTTDDNFVFFFSGHGDYDEDLDEGYWIPANARKDYPTDYISNSDVLKWVRAIKTHHTLILVDSCFSGTLVQHTRGDVLSEKYPSFRIFASGRKELVDDGTPGTNSPFAKAILSRLSYNTDRVMRASDLISNVTKTVETEVGQSPIEGRIKEAGDENGEFVFHLKITEDEIWNAVVLADTIEEYSKYLDYYPEGHYVQEVRNKIDGFDDRQDWNKAIQFGDKGSIKNYLNKHPNGLFYKNGLELLSKIEEEEIWKQAINRDTESAYRDYIYKYRNGQYVELARKKLDQFNNPINTEISKQETPTPKPFVKTEPEYPEKIKSTINPEPKKSQSSNVIPLPPLKTKSNSSIVWSLSGICILFLVMGSYFPYASYWKLVCIPFLIAIMILNRSNKTLGWIMGGLCILYVSLKWFYYPFPQFDDLGIMFLIPILAMQQSIFTESHNEPLPAYKIKKSSSSLLWILCGISVLFLIIGAYFYYNLYWTTLCAIALIATMIINRSNKKIVWLFCGFCILFLISKSIIYTNPILSRICILVPIIVLLVQKPEIPKSLNESLYDEEKPKTKTALYWTLGGISILLIIGLMVYKNTHQFNYQQYNTYDPKIPMDTVKTVSPTNEQKKQPFKEKNMQMDTVKKK